jgi:hypothetical protein
MCRNYISLKLPQNYKTECYKFNIALKDTLEDSFTITDNCVIQRINVNVQSIRIFKHNYLDFIKLVQHL